MGRNNDVCKGKNIRIGVMNFVRLEKAFCSPILAVFLIVATCAVIYSNSLNGLFLFDDIRIIVENEKIRDVSNFLQVDQILEKRPFTDLTFALNYQFGRLNVLGYHLINLLIHIINGVVVYFLSSAILGRLFKPTRDHPAIPRYASPNTEYETSIPLVALFTALIFAAHPIQTQAVTYICQRYASLAAMFYMLSVLFYLKGRMLQRLREARSISLENGGRPEAPGLRIGGKMRLFFLYSVCVLSGILAFLSKQTAASLPLAIILVEVFCIDGSRAAWKKKFAWAGAVLLLILIATLLMSGKFDGSAPFGELLEDVSKRTRDTDIVSRWNYLCTQFTVVTVYVGLLFLPLGQNADTMFPFKTSFFDGSTPFAFLFLLIIVMIALRVRKKIPALTFGIFWFFITLSVESSLIPIRDAMFEHRLYLPMFGFALGLSAAIFRWLSTRKHWAVILLTATVFAYGVAAYARNKVWHSQETLWTDVLSKSPHNYRAHANLGIVYSNKGMLTDAVQFFKKSLELKPGVRAQFNMGLVFGQLGDPETAEDYYRKAIEMDPLYAKALVNLGVILSGRENFEEAAGYFQQAVRIDPESVEAWVNLGFALMNMGNMDEAIQSYSEALRLDRMSPFANFYLGIALVRTGNPDGAKPYLLRAIEADPDLVMAHREMGLLFARKNNMDGARFHFSEVVRITPESSDGHFYLGLALVRKGDREEGIRELSEAVRLRPESVKYRTYLERLR